MTIEEQLKQLRKIAERYAQSKTRELTDWKESMMKVLSELDLQGIGNALELPLGSSIAPQVLPKIKELIEQNAELVDILSRIVEKQFDSKYSLQSLNSTISEAKELLTKHNHLKSNTNETDKI